MPKFNRRQPLTKRVRKAMRQVAFSTQETKHHRVVKYTQEILTDGTLYELNTLDTQGVTGGTFIGQEVRQVGLRMRAQLKQKGASNVLRFMIFSLEPAFQSLYNAVQVTPADIFFDKLLPLISPIKENVLKRVYMDRVMTLNIEAGTNDHIRLINKWVNLKMKKYTLVESLPSLPIGQEIIYLAVYSDSALTGDNPPTMDFHNILYYKDA